jgi:hypothetical protein
MCVAALLFAAPAPSATPAQSSRQTIDAMPVAPSCVFQANRGSQRIDLAKHGVQSDSPFLLANLERAAAHVGRAMLASVDPRLASFYAPAAQSGRAPPAIF